MSYLSFHLSPTIPSSDLEPTGRFCRRSRGLVSRRPGPSRGTDSRLKEDTGGHLGAVMRVQAGIRGTARTLEDMQPCRFGTVRPRVQISRPRPKSELRS